MRVFMSYSRSDACVAASVAEDVRQLGHAAWYDREVTGGQAWWRAILGQIRDCDLFVVVLTSHSLESQACRAEFNYASRLQKTILPVLCDDSIKVNLLPPELSRIQFVDYRAQDKRAAFALANALLRAPEPFPLPDPLPAEPPVPISYLGDLRAQIEADQEVDLGGQCGLLFEVKKRLKDPESGEDAVELLRLLRNRPDLFASVADEIDAILDRKPLETKDHPGGAPDEAYDAESIVTINLTDDNQKLQELVSRVATTSQNWTLEVGEDSLSICVERDQLVLAATFGRWIGDKEVKRLKAMGWVQESPAVPPMKRVGLVYATAGLVLLHKGARDYLKRIQMIRRFPLSQHKEAAASIVECLRILRPDAMSAAVSKAKGVVISSVGEKSEKSAAGTRFTSRDR